jgi:hypothetical protein
MNELLAKIAANLATMLILVGVLLFILWWKSR